MLLCKLLYCCNQLVTFFTDYNALDIIRNIVYNDYKSIIREVQSFEKGL